MRKATPGFRENFDVKKGNVADERPLSAAPNFGKHGLSCSASIICRSGCVLLYLSRVAGQSLPREWFRLIIVSHSAVLKIIVR